MKKPNWQIKFRDLPEIPIQKRWEKGFNHTLEQRLSQKLIQGGTTFFIFITAVMDNALNL